MPAIPIPINDSPNRSHLLSQNGMTTVSSSSSLSVSPQTPFYPPPGLASSTQNNGIAPCSPPSGMGSNSGFLKWAAAAASLGKSPPPGGFSPLHTNANANNNNQSNSNTAQHGFDIPKQSHHDDHDHEQHDSFEFGDFDDLKSRSWSKSRRAVSMSAGPGQSGITAMLSGFGSPPARDPLMSPPPLPMTVPSGGVLAEKAAKGQGVLRRLSMSGSSFGRSGFMSPTGGMTAASPPTATSASAAQATFPAKPQAEPVAPTAANPPSADQPLHRATTISGATARGRRLSEGKKRGVSPMGERLLRDHGHF